MKAHFDHIALEYDQDFTNTLVGIAQRRRVHSYLDGLIGKRNTWRILELNCGTGADAEAIARKGFSVLATDVSEEMIAVASDRLRAFTNAETRILDIKNIASLHQKFDLIFSDFGGLNCLNPDEMKTFSHEVLSVCASGTRLAWVIMGRKCLWERFYFLLKRKPVKAFRRSAQEVVQSNVAGKEVATWYYSPAEIRALFSDQFTIVKQRPVGLFVPPSYLNPFFKNKRYLLQVCEFLDRCFAFSFLANYGDHYYIEMIYKSKSCDKL